MNNLAIYFKTIDYHFPMIFVKGTSDDTYPFGEDAKLNIRINDFFISKFPVTQLLWEYIMGHNPAYAKGDNRPIEGVSFNDITQQHGFLHRFNAANGSAYSVNGNFVFRLPSETEWEYAARGGQHWKDGFRFSGSNTIDDVAWYGQNSGPHSDPDIHLKGRNQHGTETHDVGLKLPNQLGIHDLSGNIWEWCEDYYQDDINKIPQDGSPYLAPTDQRVLRGGCHHNWAIHCTVSKRYAIMPDAKDGCIGFRLVAGT